MVIYGTDGVGKTVFASKAPNVLFAASERGTDQLDVSRDMPKNYFEFLDLVEELKKTKHNYKTLAVDSLDWLEPMIWDYVCEKYSGKGGKLPNIEAFGYGRGYKHAEEVWRDFVGHMDELRDKGMHIILIGHNQIKTFQDPIQNAGYDRNILDLHQGSAGTIRQWADCVLFADFETETYQDDSKRTRAHSEGNRVVYTEKRASFDAKSRVTLPFEMKLDWDTFIASWNLSESDVSDEKLKARVKSLLRQVDDDSIKKYVDTAMKTADRDKILKIIGRLENVSAS